jgi:uncharacterized membrane protein YjfL (UPF0719 family)
VAELFQNPPGRFAHSRRFHGKKSKIARSLFEMATHLRWTIAGLMFVLAAVVMAYNKMTVCSWMRRRNPAATISFAGGLLGAAACLISPSHWLNKTWWLPTMLDTMGAPYVIVVVWIGIERWLNRREKIL